VGQVTFSAGIAPINPEVPIVVSIDRADQALYEAKRAGRNRVLMSAPVLVEDEAIQEGDLTLF